MTKYAYTEWKRIAMLSATLLLLVVLLTGCATYERHSPVTGDTTIRTFGQDVKGQVEFSMQGTNGVIETLRINGSKDASESTHTVANVAMAAIGAVAGSAGGPAGSAAGAGVGAAVAEVYQQVKDAVRENASTEHTENANPVLTAKPATLGEPDNGAECPKPWGLDCRFLAWSPAAKDWVFIGYQPASASISGKEITGHDFEANGKRYVYAGYRAPTSSGPLVPEPTGRYQTTYRLYFWVDGAAR